MSRTHSDKLERLLLLWQDRQIKEDEVQELVDLLQHSDARSQLVEDFHLSSTILENLSEREISENDEKEEALKKGPTREAWFHQWGLVAAAVILLMIGLVTQVYFDLYGERESFALQANIVSSTRVDLTWDGAFGQAESFQIERSLDGISFETIVSLDSRSTSYRSTGLSAKTDYYYRVRSTDRDGEHVYSYLVHVETPPLPSVPSAPLDLNSTLRVSQQINLVWTDASSNEDGFAIERGTNSKDFKEIARVGNNTMKYVDLGLDSNSSYVYRVRSYNEGGHSAYSNTITASTLSPLQSFLVGYWGFDEGKATDASTYHNHGTIHGAVKVKGIVGEALLFDGIDDRVEIPDHVSLDPKAITIEAWVRKTRGDSGNPVSKGGNRGYRFNLSPAGHPQFIDRGSTNSITGEPLGLLESWTHVVATGDGDGLKMYINGKLHIANNTPYAPERTTEALEIGAESDFQVEFFSGAIDEVKIYNRALSAEEILASYQQVLSIRQEGK